MTPAEAKFTRKIWRAEGLPPCEMEFQFKPDRRWRFDFAFANPGQMVAVEVQGGIWTHGRHTRGAALKREWEKLNTAAALGWRILYCEPKDVVSTEFVNQLKAALRCPA